MEKKIKIEKIKVSNKYIGIFPLEFDESADDATTANGVRIPSTIHVIPVGRWQHPVYGEIVITDSDIREFAMNFNAGIRKGVFITAGHEGAQELPAVAWFTQVEARETGLWGSVDWNDDGKELLSNKAYKFFSPEFYQQYEDSQTHQQYRNVLTGGALTKEPYFKELTPIVFSEPKINKFNESNTMNLKDLVAKKLEELTAEEKAFIKEHVAELSDAEKTALTSVIDEVETAEQKEAREAKEKTDKEAADAAAAEKATGDSNEAAGLNRDGTAKVAGSEKVQISASELAILRTAADQGKRAFAQLEKQDLDASIAKVVFSETNKNGKFLPKSLTSVRSFMESLNKAQRVAFSTLLNQIPASQVFNEIGSGAAAAATTTAEVEVLVKAKMDSNKALKYSEALKMVMSENKGLEERYDRDLPTAKQVKA